MKLSYLLNVAYIDRCHTHSLQGAISNCITPVVCCHTLTSDVIIIHFVAVSVVKRDSLQ